MAGSPPPAPRSRLVSSTTNCRLGLASFQFNSWATAWGASALPGLKLSQVHSAMPTSTSRENTSSTTRTTCTSRSSILRSMFVIIGFLGWFVKQGRVRPACRPVLLLLI